MNLTDTFIVENAELLVEQRGGKTVRRLRGTFGRCDEKNNNGRIYSKPILEREVKRIAEAMTERRLLGELDHPSHDSVKLTNVSHLITGLDFKGNELIGECELLDTPSGKVAQALIEGGVRVGISSRGMGSLSEQADGTKTVNEDFRLVTFDLVADPSTRGAFPGISESSQSELVEEIVSDTLEKAAKEKVFTTLLKDKLREKIEGEGTQSAAWTKATVKEIQKKADKKPDKPTVEEPFKNWEYWYGWNTGKPRLTRHRSYADAETVTAPAEIAESKFCILRGVILEEGNDHSVSVLLELIKEAIKNQGAAFRNSRPPGAIKRALSSMVKSAGEKAIGKKEKDPIGGVAGSLASRVGSSGMKFKQRYNSDTDRAGKAKAQTDGDKKYVPDLPQGTVSLPRSSSDVKDKIETVRKATSKKKYDAPTADTPETETVRKATSRKKYEAPKKPEATPTPEKPKTPVKELPAPKTVVVGSKKPKGSQEDAFKAAANKRIAAGERKALPAAGERKALPAAQKRKALPAAAPKSKSNISKLIGAMGTKGQGSRVKRSDTTRMARGTRKGTAYEKAKAMRDAERDK